MQGPKVPEDAASVLCNLLAQLLTLLRLAFLLLGVHLEGGTARAEG